ncbi:MAG: beta-ribofuranosylaminobenzene 5'-phosphate synthase family protein [Pseudomonadota bacterium]
MQAVAVTAPARLHLGFCDLNGELGRSFGSLGLAISGIATRVNLDPGQRRISHQAHRESERVAKVVSQICQHLEIAEPPHIEIEYAIPAHAGLGSGTQLALALGTCIAAAHGKTLLTADIARITGRGKRSGIGLSVFDQGGFVVDLGRGARTSLPPQLCQIPFPESWPVVVLSEAHNTGISGAQELEAFEELSPMCRGVAAEISHHLLMGVIPGLKEQDFEAFARSLNFIQRSVGEYFAPVQGGNRFTSDAVGTVAANIQQRWPAVCIGQSSWGPTGFVMCPDAKNAKDIENAFIAGELNAVPTVKLSVHHGWNRGAIIDTGYAAN